MGRQQLYKRGNPIHLSINQQVLNKSVDFLAFPWFVTFIVPFLHGIEKLRSVVFQSNGALCI